MHGGSGWNHEASGSGHVARQPLHLHGLARTIKIAIGDDLGVRIVRRGSRIIAGGICSCVGKLQRRSGRSVRNKQMGIFCVGITCFRENFVLREFCDAVLVSDCASKFDILLGYGANCHAGHRARVGHFRQTHDHRGRRSFLREQVIVNANDRSISNDPAVRQSRARFEKIRTGEGFVFWWNPAFAEPSAGVQRTSRRVSVSLLVASNVPLLATGS